MTTRVEKFLVLSNQFLFSRWFFFVILLSGSHWPMMNFYESMESLTSSLHRWVAINWHIKGVRSTGPSKALQSKWGKTRQNHLLLLAEKLWTIATYWVGFWNLCCCPIGCTFIFIRKMSGCCRLAFDGLRTMAFLSIRIKLSSPSRSGYRYTH
jgi:hypothetical protein